MIYIPLTNNFSPVALVHSIYRQEQRRRRQLRKQALGNWNLTAIHSNVRIPLSKRRSKARGTHSPSMCHPDVLVSPKSSSQEAKSQLLEVSNAAPISLIISSLIVPFSVQTKWIRLVVGTLLQLYISDEYCMSMQLHICSEIPVPSTPADPRPSTRQNVVQWLATCRNRVYRVWLNFSSGAGYTSKGQNLTTWECSEWWALLVRLNYTEANKNWHQNYLLLSAGTAFWRS